ncbi:MAG: S41 family peptidase [Selenomonadaceae bacterium]|nr:S41 family peptidase [Selenomonadaceae bacterium]
MGKKILYVFILVGAMAFSSFCTIFGFCLIFDLDEAKVQNLTRFFGAMQFIESKYVTEVDDKKLIDGAITGMVKALDDPHSIYLDENLYKQLKNHTEGTFGGIGVYMGFRDGGVQVVAVMPDSPGEKAGLQANDSIVSVNGTPITEMQPEEVVMNIRGEVGTDVELVIHREGEVDKAYKITRDVIQMKTVDGSILEDGIGYIRIVSFTEKSNDEFRTVYDNLISQGMKGLIIDVRENPGGVITSCVDIARMVVPKGRIVSVINRDGEEENYDSTLEKPISPMVILIDGNSASASEILAGALQDTKAATVIGTKSYGKGSVQVLMPMFQSDGLKLTVAKYYTPNGRSIDGTGIEPDITVELPADAQSDLQLDAALDFIRQHMLPSSPTGE